MSNYQKDYQLSLKKEIEFEGYMRQEYKFKTENSQEKGKFPDWDVKVTAITSNVSSYEIKYNANYSDPDFSAGTIVIEYGRIINQLYHPSGLDATKADYYVLTFQDTDQFYLIETNKLKDLCLNTQVRKKVLYDKNNYRIFIFDRPWLKSQCFTI